MEPKTSVLDPQTPKSTTPADSMKEIKDVVSSEVKPLVKPLNTRKLNKGTVLMILGSFFAVSLGVLTGWFLAGTEQKSSSGPISSEISSKNGEVEEAGIADEATFRDSAEGLLKKGGIKGEGTHYLDRNLGEDKYVYLTSTVIDLDSFLDKKVTVWGETISARFAGWLMDVGKIKVVK